MKQYRPLIWGLIAMLLAATAQGRLSHLLHIRGAQPDFVLVTLACAGVLLGSEQAVLLGLWAGLLMGAMVPMNYGAFLVSRVLAGALAGYLNRSVIRDSLLVPPLAVLVVTTLAEVVFMLIEPSIAIHSLRVWSEKVGGEILYNMVLAIPIYFLLRRLGLGIRAEDSFGVRS